MGGARLALTGVSCLGVTMIRLCLILGLAVGLSHAQVPDPEQARSEVVLGNVLNFEAEPNGTLPGGWGGGPRDTLFVDELMPRSGKRAARIERTAASAEAFSTMTKSLPVGFSGNRIELRGYLRSEDVSEYFGFWLRLDGSAPNLAFDSMQSRQIKGTTDWTEHVVSVPLRPGARTVVFGFLVSGTGGAWADDLQLLVDGKPVWEAPKAEKVETVLDRDKEFDAGSKISLAPLSPAQIGNLTTLGRVWGFLKYHHPRVTAGQLHWDYELFRVLPEILAAPDRAAGNAALLRWVDATGKSQPAGPASKVAEQDLHLTPDIGWINDQAVLGADLSQRLAAIHAHRPAKPEQFYVALTPGVRNPVFERELGYPQIKGPDAGYQLLGLFRFWNIIRYWFPYRDLLEGDWDATLAEFIPRIALAPDRDAYQLEMMALIARVHDTHANLWSSPQVRPPVGDSQLPVKVRFIGQQAVVTHVLAPAGAPPPFEVGDIITAIDEVPVARLVETWTPYYAASNEPTRLRDIARALTKGPAGDVKLTVTRKGESLTIISSRVPIASVANMLTRTHDLPGEAFRLLSPDVAYLKLSAVTRETNMQDYINRAAGTKGLIIDIRNYPGGFVVFTLGTLLVDRPSDFARFTKGDLANPGAFNFTPPVTLQPQAPRYAGRVIILIDEISQSNAEYTAMALRTAPQAVVIGSTTAGADGNVSAIPLPGGLRTMISGIGVFYPDKRPTQRVGIIPDIEARPTLEGIRAGRDEVLEEGLRQILGPETAADEIRKLVPAQVGVSGVVRQN
jgi:C-terminal processing protease CtpA/Prc